MRATTFLACLLLAAPALGRSSAPIDGPWSGTLAVPGAAELPATLSLTRSGKRRVRGTLGVPSDTAPISVGVKGRARGARAQLRGAEPGVKLRWRGRWDAEAQAWSGPVVLKTPGGKTRGELTLVRPGDVFSESCGALAYFTDTVTPTVTQPICSQCHVPGGLAAGARFRVTPDDPAATMLSALPFVNADDPTLSRILQKPRAEVAHGGGVQIVPGSDADQALVHWVELVVSPACGGGDHGGPTTPGDLFADNCASCHGGDARGTPGRPDIHCNRSIHDPVRYGRVGDAEDMPAFPDLSDADVEDLQGYLIGLCPSETVTGAELFTSNCATCHGADAGGTSGRPNIRCATRVDDAVRIGRAALMPSFPALYMPDVELGRLESYLSDLCVAAGRTPEDLWDGNCATCHGATAGGGTNALGVHGPDIRCTALGDYLEKVREGDGGMPSFPALSDADVAAIQGWVATGFCNP